MDEKLCQRILQVILCCQSNLSPSRPPSCEGILTCINRWPSAIPCHLQVRIRPGGDWIRCSRYGSRMASPGMAGHTVVASDSVCLRRSTRSTMRRCCSGKTATWTTSSTSSKATGATSSACEPPAPLWPGSMTPLRSALPALISLTAAQALSWSIGGTLCKRQLGPCQASRDSLLPSVFRFLKGCFMILPTSCSPCGQPAARRSPRTSLHASRRLASSLTAPHSLTAPAACAQVRVQQDRRVQHRGGGRDRAHARLHPLLRLAAAQHGRPPGAHVGHDGPREGLHQAGARMLASMLPVMHVHQCHNPWDMVSVG